MNIFKINFFSNYYIPNILPILKTKNKDNLLFLSVLDFIISYNTVNVLIPYFKVGYFSENRDE